MYRLRAVIAAEPVLRVLTDGVEAAHLVPLDQDLTLLPLTEALLAAFPAGLEGALGECSTRGPVAYVEADYWGGRGTQRAQVWDGGAVVLGPLDHTEEVPFPPDGSPVSKALRRLGVAKGDHYDEFDAVGLGRHRDTDRWLSSTA